MKTKTSILALIICLYSICSFSQKNKYDNSIFWEIKKTKSSPPSYILGTIHMMDTSQIKFPLVTFSQLIDKCGNLCTEASLKMDSSQSVEFGKRMLLPSFDRNITNSLDKEYYIRLTQIVDSAKSELKLLKPALAYIRPTALAFLILAEKQLSSSVLYKTTNFGPEKYFEEYARAKGYEINQLETMQQQIEWYFAPKITFEKSLEVLKQSLDDFNNNDSIDMFLNYRNQNLLLVKPEAYNDSIMILRNKGMADGIDNLIMKRPTFVMIGAAHLPYENGVLNLLAKKGYYVKPYLVNLKRN